MTITARINKGLPSQRIVKCEFDFATVPDAVMESWAIAHGVVVIQNTILRSTAESVLKSNPNATDRDIAVAIQSAVEKWVPGVRQARATAAAVNEAAIVEKVTTELRSAYVARLDTLLKSGGIDQETYETLIDLD